MLKPVMPVIKAAARSFPDGRVKCALRTWFFRRIVPLLTTKANNLPLGHGIHADIVAPRLTSGAFSTIEIEGYLKHVLPKPGDIVVDLGAYVGMFTIVASHLVGPTGRVISVEADPQNYGLLQRNVARNHLSNVTTIRVGVGGEMATMYLHSRGNCSELTREQIIRRGKSMFRGSPTRVVTLDWLAQEMGLTRMDFVKMDIEGAELDVLRGAPGVLNKMRPHFAIASYHIVDGHPTWKTLHSQFQEAGYEALTDFPAHLTTYASAKDPPGSSFQYSG